MIATKHSISPTQPSGVGTIGDMDAGQGGDNDSIDEEGLFDAVIEDVTEGPDAHVGCEEAPI